MGVGWPLQAWRPPAGLPGLGRVGEGSVRELRVGPQNCGYESAHRCSHVFGALGSWSLKRSGPICLVLRGPEDQTGWDPAGHTLSQGKAATGRPCSLPPPLPRRSHSGSSLSGRRRGPQRWAVLDLPQLCASGTSWGGSGWLSWARAPETPGPRAPWVYTETSPPACSALWRSLGLARGAPCPHQNSLGAFFHSRGFVCLFPVLKMTTISNIYTFRICTRLHSDDT